MKREVRILPDAGALYSAAAAEFVESARESARARGVFNVVLSGGSTPKALYSRLATDSALRTQVPWDRMNFFWGDERHVPPDHPDSNFRMANDAMLSRAAVKPAQIFRIQGELPNAEDAAAGYEKRLRDLFHLAEGQFPRFDLVLLGMGPDGHTASLFPGTKALEEQKRLVVANWIGKLDSKRMTMTAPVFNGSSRILFLVLGEDKAPALKAVLEGPFEPAQLPAQLIRPQDGAVVWLVDRAAGHMLTQEEQ